MNEQTKQQLNNIITRLEASLKDLQGAKLKLGEKIASAKAQRAKELDEHATNLFPGFSAGAYGALKDRCPGVFSEQVEELFANVWATKIPFFVKLFKQEEKYLAEKFSVEADLVRAKIKQLGYKSIACDQLDKLVEKTMAELKILSEKEKSLAAKIKSFREIYNKHLGTNLSLQAQQNIAKAHAKLNHQVSYVTYGGYNDYDANDDLLFFASNAWLYNSLNASGTVGVTYIAQPNYSGNEGQSGGAGASGAWDQPVAVEAPANVVVSTGEASSQFDDKMTEAFAPTIATDDSLGRFS